MASKVLYKQLLFRPSHINVIINFMSTDILRVVFYKKCVHCKNW